MRWLLSLTVGLVTAVCCNAAWATWSGRDFAWWAPGEESLGTVRYEDLGSTERSPFVELAPGVLALEHEPYWSFGKARAVRDVDGDGIAELAVTGRALTGCGNDVRGDLQVFSGSRLTPVGKYSGYAHFELWPLSNGDLLERRSHGWRGPRLRLLTEITGPPRWTRNLTNWTSAEPIGDGDGDGFDDIAVCDGLATGGLGSVTLLAGRDGRVLWNRLGEVKYASAGNATAAGDWNRDGVDDVAASFDHRIEILSGLDGTMLERIELDPSVTLIELDALGDLDGDGRSDFALRVKRPGPDGDSYPIVSLRADRAPGRFDGQWLDVTDGWELEWSAPAADRDGSGDELILGRRHPQTGERRVSSYSSGGLRDLELELGLEPAIAFRWRSSGPSPGTVVHFEPEGPRYALVSAGRELDRSSRNLLLMIALD